MSHLNKTFTTQDPRDIDGNPFEVADIAVGQAAGLADILSEVIDVASRMARNSAMSRVLESGDELSAKEWALTPEGRKWAAVDTQVLLLKKDLGLLRQAAAFDPKHPPREV